MRKPIVAEGPGFTAKKAMARLRPKGARVLSALLYEKHRRMLKTGYFRAGVELIRIGSKIFAQAPSCSAELAKRR